MYMMILSCEDFNQKKYLFYLCIYFDYISVPFFFSHELFVTTEHEQMRERLFVSICIGSLYYFVSVIIISNLFQLIIFFIIIINTTIICC